MNCIRNQIDK